MTPRAARLTRVAEHDTTASATLDRLIRIAERGLPQMYLDGEFVFTLRGERRPDGSWTASAVGNSLRYGAIVALGLRLLPESAQRDVLGGETSYDLVGRLAKRLDEITSPGDAALLCWAAADIGHADLPRILARLIELDRRGTSGYVVDSRLDGVGARRSSPVRRRGGGSCPRARPPARRSPRYPLPPRSERRQSIPRACRVLR